MRRTPIPARLQTDVRKRSARIQKLVAVAAAEERRFGQLTGSSQSRLNEQRCRLGELNAYRASYAERAQGNRDLRSAHWKDFRDFLARLDEAVQAQRRIVEECEQSLDAHRRQWLHRRRRLESLEKVQERFCKDEQRQAERLEQRRADDRPPAAALYDEDG